MKNSIERINSATILYEELGMIMQLVELIFFVENLLANLLFFFLGKLIVLVSP